MEADSPDDRSDNRSPIELKVEYKGLNAFFADYTRNISKGGTFIHTEKPLPIGTEFVFQLQIPDQGALKIRGQVRWIVEVGQKEEAGMGIRFIYDQDGERAKVEGIVEELMVSSLGRLVTQKLLARSRTAEDGAKDNTP